jgi:putative polyketide hydroxylase
MLLAGADDRNWIQAAAEVADSFPGLPLHAYCVGKDLGDPESRFSTTYGISSQGATLVRPDGFIAWRSPGGSVDCSRVLRGALAQSLGVG